MFGLSLVCQPFAADERARVSPDVKQLALLLLWAALRGFLAAPQRQREHNEEGNFSFFSVFSAGSWRCCCERSKRKNERAPRPSDDACKISVRLIAFRVFASRGDKQRFILLWDHPAAV